MNHVIPAALALATAVSFAGCHATEPAQPSVEAQTTAPGTLSPSADGASFSSAQPRPAGPLDSAAPSASAPVGAARVWAFEADPVDGAPSGFSFGRTGQGREGRWRVLAD